MYVQEFFALNAENLKKIHRLKPNFGYDGFGEIVFYRTYSRIKHDGGQENWHDVVVRVINGTMSVRKDWYKKNFIEWDEEYWQQYALGMAIAMFKMYWLPAGRGMWQMGTQFVFERGAMSLNNCFAGETKFFNNDQLVTLKSYAGQKVLVNTDTGIKKLATVQSFGVQKLYTYVFKPAVGKSKYKLKYTATNNHRWILADGSETTYLQAGDRVKVIPGKVKTESQDYKDGLVHGLVFADGCNFYNDNYYIQLCGWKEKLRGTLMQSEWYSHTIETEQRIILTTKKSLKNLPTDESIEYKQGFLDGWKLFDGYAKKQSYCLDTTDTDAVQWLSDYSGVLNYVMVGHSVESGDTNYGPRNKPLNRIKLRFEPVEFIVDCRLDSGRTEEVFCVVEPDTNTFQLAGGVITGNCGFTKLGGNDRLSNDLHWLMDALMLGVGVGFEPIRDNLKIFKPVGVFDHYILDSREGWCNAVAMLIDAYIKPNMRKPRFHDKLVRKKGEPIRGFGGLSSGPEPLMKLLAQIEALFETPDIDVVRLKADLANMIGCCVVAGNVRRSAELLKLMMNDTVALDLKDYEKNPEREDWGYMSNNSVALYKDSDYECLGEVARRVVTRGEPGIMNLKNFRYGRLSKGHLPAMREDKADGLNPLILAA